MPGQAPLERDVTVYTRSHHAACGLAFGPLAALIALLLATDSAHAQTPMTGYIATPTDQLGVPGNQASGEITPEGDIYTGWAEYELRFGRELRPWDQPTRILPAPAVPLFIARLSDRQMLYTQQIFTIPIAGQPVVYMTLIARNLSKRSQTARAALQIEYTREPLFAGTLRSPYRYDRPSPNPVDNNFSSQLGEMFDPNWDYVVAGRDVIRDGLLLDRGPSVAGQLEPTAPSSSMTAPHAKVAYRQRLAPGHSASFTWKIPLAPPAASSLADASLDAVSMHAARVKLLGVWRAQEAGMTRISVPESRVNAVYQANVVQMLQSRYLTPAGWLQAVNKLQYQAYWIRDSAVETEALDLVGLHQPAAQNLAYLASYQQPSGLYISQSGQQDGVGQALWELAQHAQLMQSRAFAQSQLASVGAAVNWIAQTSAADSLGLLAPSTTNDNEFIVDGHITGDNLWAAVGLRSAVRLAQVAGRPDLAASWQAIDTRFEVALDRAIAQAAARAGHIPPALDVTGGFDWGNYWAAYPLPILNPRSPLVGATIAWETAHSAEGLATWSGSLHDYLGFPIFESELEAGNVAAALRGFYAELVHTTATGYGWEDGPTPYGSRQLISNLTPHGTFAGQFVTLLRNMLVRDDGNAVDLLAGVSPAWLKPGDRISVSSAPTDHGVISLQLTASRHGATLRWSSDIGNATPLYWTLPYWVATAAASDGARVRRKLRLPGASGSLTLRWSGRMPAQSYALAVGALNHSYRAHRHAAPIVPARGW